MLLAQVTAMVAVGVPFPGATPGQAALAGPRKLEVDGLAFIESPGSPHYWLVNDKGYVVRGFPRDANSQAIKEWREGKSLQVGYTAPDPRATVTPVPMLGPVTNWLDVVAMGMRFAMQPKAARVSGEKGLLVLFLSSYGPADHLYVQRLNIVYEAASKVGVSILGLFPGKGETKASVARFTVLHKLGFSCALDAGNAYADAFRASRTPEAFLLDAQMKVVYGGAIDDSTYGGETARNYLLNAIRDFAESGSKGTEHARVRYPY